MEVLYESVFTNLQVMNDIGFIGASELLDTADASQYDSLRNSFITCLMLNYTFTIVGAMLMVCGLCYEITAGSSYYYNCTSAFLAYPSTQVVMIFSEDNDGEFNLAAGKALLSFDFHYKGESGSDIPSPAKIDGIKVTATESTPNYDILDLDAPRETFQAILNKANGNVKDCPKWTPDSFAVMKYVRAKDNIVTYVESPEGIIVFFQRL
ncbi:hypothetical protein FOL47_000333 [Perkinsus chesapeaki]|uniref:Uncharacterized protein n=1 Tax=Perkinsus chesapeaki TaxID=330153 RepID=A0A7J6MLY1_PERCH|nr:hypothetical protein FOL47_000333 [Perkinsus chesapeaki]